MVVTMLLVSALGTSTLANCVAVPAFAPQEQMACCKNGHDQCPMHRSKAESAADCCQHDGQRNQELTAAEQQPAHGLAVTFERVAGVTPHAAMPAALAKTCFAPYSDRSASPPTPGTSSSTVLLI
jgi:hypothetical protein